MSKRKVFILATVFALSFMGSAYAQNTAIKVAYVDLSKIFDEYGKTKEYDKLLEQKHSTFEKEHNDKLQKIKESQDKLSLLKDEEKNKMIEQIDKQKAELMEFDRQKQADLRKQRDEKIREILLEIEKVIKDYAVQEKYTLVFNDKVLAYADASMDITASVLKLLNDRYAGQGK